MKAFKAFIGYSPEQVSHTEKLVSVLGGFIGILLVTFISYHFVGLQGAKYVVPSIGASAVLIFAIPHGKLSQPWPVFGGHFIAALIGVTCYKFIPDVFIASALAVAMTIGAMHYLACIHPPGGATALTAIFGGETVTSLGYSYALTPVLLNVILIFIVAILFNAFFPWRRYPASLVRRKQAASQAQAGAPDLGGISQDDLDYAMKKMDLLVDMTVEDLTSLYAVASKHSQSKQLRAAQILLDHYYSNGLFGNLWEVRHIIDESRSDDPSRDKVIYKIVAGPGRRGTGTCTREQFAGWARYEVERNENSWQRKDTEVP